MDVPVDMSPEEAARYILDHAVSRTAIKRFAKWVDRVEAADVRRQLLDEGRRRGADLPEGSIDWPSKRLIRVARGLEAQARVRRNPIRNDENFVCENCHADVSAHGRTARNHCPFCLYSKHVDDVPGDRMAKCGGLMAPKTAVRVKQRWVLVHECQRCGFERKNQVLDDGDTPDDMQRIAMLFQQEPTP